MAVKMGLKALEEYNIIRLTRPRGQQVRKGEQSLKV